MFDEYLASQGNWLESNLMLRLRTTSNLKSLGEEEFIPFHELKTKHGATTAKQMRHQKLELQKRCKPGDTPFVMDHPDLPNDPESELHLVSHVAASASSLNQYSTMQLQRNGS